MSVAPRENEVFFVTGMKVYLQQTLSQKNLVKAAFHYSSQLQTWSIASKSKACRKPAANSLKRVFFYIPFV